MKLSNLTTVLFVKDINAAKDFYTEILDQDIKLDFGKSITFETGFAIWEIRDSHVIPQALGKESLYLLKAKRFELCFETEDINFVHKKLVNYGVEFLHEINEEIWGQQTLRFYDCDNHLIEIGETLEVFVKRFHKHGMNPQEIAKRTFIPQQNVEELLKSSKSI